MKASVAALAPSDADTRLRRDRLRSIGKKLDERGSAGGALRRKAIGRIAALRERPAQGPQRRLILAEGGESEYSYLNMRPSAPFLRRVTVLPEKVDPGRHPFNVEALRCLDLELGSRVTFFVGENGSGKSTLLEGIARCCEFNVTGGGRDHQSQMPPGDGGELASALRLSWLPKATDGFFLRAESFSNFASYIDQTSNLGRYGGRPLTEQSHGESFLALFLNRFRCGIYILDEPEAALSPQRQLAFLKVIRDLDAQGQSQFLIASHSPILLAYPEATLISLDGGRIHNVAYRDTDHYRITKAFLDSPERFFKHLFTSSIDNEGRD